jgi:D-alanyl-D-alanine carboxypeptidase
MDQKSLLDKIIDDVIITFKERWKVFLLSLVTQLCITSLLYLGIRTPQQLDFLNIQKVGGEQQATTVVQNPLPTPQPRIDFWESLKSKLQQKPNDFHLNKETSLVPVAYAAGDYDQASAYAAVDFDSGQILAEKNLSQKIPMASLTKIMTAIVTLDLASPDDTFTVTDSAASTQPTSIGVVPGQKMTVRELLQAAMMTSANDAVQVIKDNIDQKFGEETFVNAMNTKAEYLGLKDTHFTNPQGFDNPGHYSSAADLSTLSHYALHNYPLITEVVQKDYQYLPEDQNHKQFDLYNWNGLLGVYPGVYGIKIGNTQDAGYTTIVVSQREGKSVLAVVLGAPGVLERDLWASQLLDTGFEKLGLQPVGVTPAELQAKYATWKYWG